MPRRNGGNKHGRSGASEQRYATLLIVYEGSEKNGTRISDQGR